jgi:hypothetical protein
MDIIFLTALRTAWEIKLDVNIDHARTRLHVSHGVGKLLAHDVVKSLEPVGRLYGYWGSAYWTRICPLKPVVNTAPMEYVITIERILCTSNSLEANGAFWKVRVGAVMNTKL